MHWLFIKLGAKNKDEAKKLFWQFVKFGVIGVVNTLVSLAIYYAFLFINSNLYLVGHILGWVLSVACSFFLNRKFVFKNTDVKVWVALLKSYLAYGAVFLLTTLLMYIQVEIIGISEIIAPLINLVVSVPLNFLLNKFWTFREKSALPLHRK